MPEKRALPGTEHAESRQDGLRGNIDNSELVVPKVENLKPSATARIEAMGSKQDRSTTGMARPMWLA